MTCVFGPNAVIATPWGKERSKLDFGRNRHQIMDPAELEEISAALEQDAALREVCLCPSSRRLMSKLTPPAQKLRDQSSELEKKTRMMMGVLNRIHFTKQENGQNCL